jgi:uncharacterized protein (TIGR02145 family)
MEFKMKKSIGCFWITYLVSTTILSTQGFCQADQEGKSFKTKKIGNLVWMTENLKVDHYRNGDVIPEVKDKKKWENLKTGAWCYYNNVHENGKKFGKLYNWYAVNDRRGLAPKGWHIPTPSEYEALKKSVYSDGNLLKAVGQGRGSGAGKNTSGFCALLAGGRGNDGPFGYLGDDAYFWSSGETGANSMSLGFRDSYILFGHNDKEYGFSIRCVKD